MKNIITIILFLLFIEGCSISPSVDRFKKNLDYHIGEEATDSYGVYKNNKIGNKKYSYIRFYNHTMKKECKYIRVTDLNNIIIEHKILTLDGCRTLPGTS